MSAVQKIAELMLEQIPAPGLTSTMSGAAQAQSAMNVLPGQEASTGFESDVECCDDIADQYTPEYVAAAKDFVAMVGGADIARDLIDKVDEALDVFSDGEDDAEAIDLVATLIPATPDMPMQKSMTRISSMYDPDSGE